MELTEKMGLGGFEVLWRSKMARGGAEGGSRGQSRSLNDHKTATGFALNCAKKRKMDNLGS
jgi:hypothetical protein